MFAAAETVGRFRPTSRARLAIVGNGGGPGVLAADRVAETGGTLATLAPETQGGRCPRRAGANPLDLRADATPERYAAALDALAADPGVDALLVIQAPNVLADPLAVAAAVAGQVGRRNDRRQAGLRLLDGRRQRPATRAARCAPPASPATTHRPRRPPRSAT